VVAPVAAVTATRTELAVQASLDKGVTVATAGLYLAIFLVAVVAAAQALLVVTPVQAVVALAGLAFQTHFALALVSFMLAAVAAPVVRRLVCPLRTPEVLGGMVEVVVAEDRRVCPLLERRTLAAAVVV
jgi:hypothetical protein